MQEHSFSIEVDGPPPEVWKLFWYRGNDRPRSSDVTIQIIHPGDDVGEGLVRHCTFKVPRYLLTGGIGHSWELLTQVKPYESWKYDAIGKPLWSRAEGWTRLEEIGGGRTRLHFRETYHAFNPLTRVLLERRVHDFISRGNDEQIARAVNSGLRWLRSTTDAANDAPAGPGGGAAHEPDTGAGP